MTRRQPTWRVRVAPGAHDRRVDRFVGTDYTRVREQLRCAEVRGESGKVPQVARLQGEGSPRGRAETPPGPNVVIRRQDGRVRRSDGLDRGLKGLADSTRLPGRPGSYRILLICL